MWPLTVVHQVKRKPFVPPQKGIHPTNFCGNCQMNPSGRKRTKRSKEFKNDRLEYLDQLVVEFQTSESQGAEPRAFSLTNIHLLKT